MITNTHSTSERLKWNFGVKMLQIFLFLTFLLAFIYLVDGVANQSSLFSDKTGLQTDGKTLITSLFSFIAALSSIWSVVTSRQSASRIEELKYQNAREIEDLKQQLTTQFPALKESRSAALKYYRVLSTTVETASIDRTSWDQCENSMKEAEANVYFLSKDYKDKWYEYWQTVDTISKRIAQEQDPTTIKENWRNDWSKRLAEGLEFLADYQPGSSIVYAQN